MLDREGFRPNVGIILLNSRNQVFWGKRLRTHSWQFPQGGIKYGESPEQAMYRELHEEVGLRPEHVQILARTRDWMRYEVPDHFIRKDARGHYRGQKQICAPTCAPGCARSGRNPSRHRSHPSRPSPARRRPSESGTPGSGPHAFAACRSKPEAGYTSTRLVRWINSGSLA